MYISANMPWISALRGKFFFTPDRSTPTPIHPDPDPTRRRIIFFSPDRTAPKISHSIPTRPDLGQKFFTPDRDPDKFPTPRPDPKLKSVFFGGRITLVFTQYFLQQHRTPPNCDCEVPNTEVLLLRVLIYDCDEQCYTLMQTWRRPSPK